MKKTIGLLLAILMAATTLPALAQEHIGWVDITPMEAPEASLYAILAGGNGVVVIPPDGVNADDFLYQGIRFVAEGNDPGPFENDQQLKVTSAQALPAVIGSINEKGDGYIVVNVSESGAIIDNMPTLRLNITAETEVQSDYETDSFVMVVYDDATQNALMILVSNG